MTILELLYSIWNYVEVISAIVNTVVNISYNFFFITTWIGKTMVYLIFVCFDGMYCSVCSLVNGISIMCEDFAYFVSDLENIFSYVGSWFECAYDFLVTFVCTMIKSCFNIVYSLVYSFVYVKDGIFNIYRNGMRAIYDCIVTFKGAIVLIGHVIWACVTFIPAIFVYIIGLFVFFINRSAEEVKSIVSAIFNILLSLLSEIYLFMTDMPIESVCGLFVGFLLLYFIRKFKTLLASVAKKYFLLMSRNIQEILVMSLMYILSIVNVALLKLKHVIHSVKQTVLNHLAGDVAEPNSRESLLAIQKNHGDARLCVVCKDSESNVVIIPCKHMCLCEDCSNYDIFTDYRTSSCPVCRQHIDRMLKVYL